jgi:lipid A ethanolaminephosphotransferase
MISTACVTPPWLRWPQWHMSTEGLALASSLFFAVACNTPFLRGALAGHSSTDPRAWLFGAAVVLMLAALHFLMLSLVLHRLWARPLVAGLIVATALATYYMQRFNIYLDPSMLRNILHTNVKEARELLGWGMAWHLLLYAVVPLLVLWRVRLSKRTVARAVMVRAGCLVLGLATLLGSLLLVFQDMSALMRNHKELRYLITPANFIYSTARVLGSEARAVRTEITPVGLNARQDASWSQRTRPVLLVLVVGETARAANWGLSGYERQTTPELAKLNVINFSDVTACGTNTETSLPCMFAPIGRRDYDEHRIRNSESLLHALQRAGFAVLWRDNQSGCKGVCNDLPTEQLNATTAPELCSDEGHCLDEALLSNADTLARDAKGNMVLVLHMLGNHGPAYFKRYPTAFQRFTPTCNTSELHFCSREQIVNTYDNALLYTDHVLGRTIAFLQRQTERFDTAMVYVSDHGESLGEKGLFLHGMPFAIAPTEQTKVPMVWWLSPGFESSFGLNRECLQTKALQPASHDHLFHSVLGLLRISANEFEPKWDLTQGCR